MRCRGCGELLYTPRFRRELDICAECGAHGSVPAWWRIEQLFDPGPPEVIATAPAPGDPLEFVDTQPYSQRLRDARASTGLDEAVVCVRGTIKGAPVVAAVMDFRFLGGSLGAGVGELITLAAEHALETRTPLLLVTASGGARMQEGVISLMQMAKTAQALGELDAAGVLTVSLITDPTYGGVAASFATITDVIIAEPGARLGFAGRRVIEQTIRASLPPGFQTAEFLLAAGMIDAICPRGQLRDTLGKILSAGMPVPETTVPERSVIIRDPLELAVDDPWSVLRQARDLGRPSTLDLVYGMLDWFVELRGDRVSGDCPALVGGIGSLHGIPVVLTGHQKGADAAELTRRNFGMALPSGYRKAGRLMRLADKLGLPVITLVDTPGAYPGVEAEEGGQALAIAENIKLMTRLSVPVVSVVLGEGGSGGALGLAVADRCLMFSGAVYSVISPEGCAAILWKDPAAAATAAAALRITAPDLLRLGIVDGVIQEPAGGNRAGDPEVVAALRDAVRELLAELSEEDPVSLGARRRNRFREFGSGVQEVGDDSRRAD